MISRISLLLIFTLGSFWGCEDAPAPAQIGDTCTSIVECASGDKLTCLNNMCTRKTCTRTAECPPDSACVDSYCDDAQCSQDSDCAAGGCFEGRCIPNLCKSSADCDAGLACRGAPPKCVTPPTRCVRDADCPNALGCVVALGICKKACVDDAQCATGEYCEDLCRPLCVGDEHCRGTEICRDDRCVPINDCPSVACESARPFQDPITCQCVGCVNDFDCLEQGTACADSQICTYCPIRAESENTCRAQGLFLVDGCCVECTADADCSFGTSLACNRGRCEAQSASECAKDTDCPSAGQVCDNGRCREGGSLVSCALQNDCPQDEACYSDGICRTQANCACVAPSRCVAEPGDTLGTCAGCTTHCAEDGCAQGQLCVVLQGNTQGFCAQAEFSGCL